jgi:outer membrane lipoprotein-sorting protein
MKRLLSATMLLALAASSLSALTGEELIKLMDRNTDYATISCTYIMTIHIGTESREKTMQMKGIGAQRALTRFTNPEDEGVKYLKINKDLWIYFPKEQETVKISGHMLKEGMMGSDISYEDALESDGLLEKYSASIDGEAVHEGKACHVLSLTARRKDAPYELRKLLVDKQLFIAWKEEMYAKSGRLLKEGRMLEVRKFGQRWFPVKGEFINKLRANSRTEFEMKDIKLDIPMRESDFSLRMLERG